MEENKNFNARIEEDEMIIDIAEYEEMKKQIEDFKLLEETGFKIRDRLRTENQELKDENYDLKQKIKALGQIIADVI